MHGPQLAPGSPAAGAPPPAAVLSERVFYWGGCFIGAFFFRGGGCGRRLGDKGHFLTEHISRTAMSADPHDEHAACVLKQRRDVLRDSASVPGGGMCRS